MAVVYDHHIRIISVGDKVKYKPRQILEDNETVGTITQTAAYGNIFNQDMIVIDKIDHWIPARECVKL